MERSSNIKWAKQNESMKPKKITRKPDMETESMRMWVENEEEAKAEKEFQKNNPNAYVEIKKGDLKFHLNGFTKCSDKKTKKLVFAYKFKHAEKQIIYYSFVQDERNKNMIEVLSATAEMIGYQTINFEDIMDNVISQEHSIDKLSQMAKTGKSAKNESLGSSTINDNTSINDIASKKNSYIG